MIADGLGNGCHELRWPRLSVKSGEAMDEDILLPGGVESRLDDLGPDERDEALEQPGELWGQFFSPGEELQHLREGTWAVWARQR